MYFCRAEIRLSPTRFLLASCPASLSLVWLETSEYISHSYVVPYILVLNVEGRTAGLGVTPELPGWPDNPSSTLFIPTRTYDACTFKEPMDPSGVLVLTAGATGSLDPGGAFKFAPNGPFSAR